MSRQRILFVASQTGSRSDGGLESSTRIFERLADDYEWSMVTTHETWFTDRWRRRGANVRVVRFDERQGRMEKFARFARWNAVVLRTAIAHRPGVVHANDLRAFEAAYPAARVVRRPILLTQRDTKPEGAVPGRQWHQAAHRCRTIVTLSDGMGDYLHAHTGVARSRLLTINSMVDLQRFRPPLPEERSTQRARLGVGPADFLVGCVGVVRDKKNQIEILTRMLPELRKLVPESKLHFFGDYEPAHDDYCRRFAAVLDESGLQRVVTMHGHQSDMAGNYQALDAIVIGSRNEGLARCMIEGMAVGVPVVSFDVCSAREMLEPTGAGVVVRQGDHAGLAAVLAALAGDPQRRSTMGTEGRRAAELRFDPECIAAAFRALYDEALAA
jgi:glycosyltransferase involved in cell wall biosynthesis